MIGTVVAAHRTGEPGYALSSAGEDKDSKSRIRKLVPKGTDMDLEIRFNVLISTYIVKLLLGDTSTNSGGPWDWRQLKTEMAAHAAIPPTRMPNGI